MKNRLAVAVMLMTALLLSSFQSFSQEKRQLGVKDALELSIKNSRQLKVNAAKIQEASAAVKEAEERRLPDVKASASALVLSNATVDIKTKQSSSGGSNDIRIVQLKEMRIQQLNTLYSWFYSRDQI